MQLNVKVFYKKNSKFSDKIKSLVQNELTLDLPFFAEGSEICKIFLIESLSELKTDDNDDAFFLNILMSESISPEEEATAIFNGVDEAFSIGKITPEGFRRIIINSFSRKLNRIKNDELKDKIMESSKLTSLGLMATGIAHELNNPLMALKGFSYMLSQEGTSQARINEISNKVSAIADRMARVVDGIRVFSKERDFDSSEVFRPLLVINEVVGFMEMVLAAKGVKIEVQNKASVDLQIWGNRNKFESIFQNLLSNSADAVASANRAEGKIIISTEKTADNKIRISLIDDGPGMTKEVRDRLFDPFFTTKELGKGTGLGMGIVKDAIEVHKGTIQVKSELGKGSKFIIEIPIDRRGRTGKINYTKIKRYEAGKVVIVDDDELVTEALGEHFNIETYNSSVDALAKIGEEVSLVITDLVMPNIDGYELGRAIKDKHPKIPIWLITTNKKLKNIEDEFFLPFDKVIVKSITDFENLVQDIDALFS